MKKISIKGNYNQVSLGDINNFYISRYSNIDHKLVIDSKNIFSKKLTMIITEITKYEKDFGIEDISDILEYDSLSELTRFINSDCEPSNKFLEYFASKMFISSEWMRFSRSYIFNYPGIRCLFVSELYELLLKEDFEKMYFLTSDAKEREVMILLKYRNYVFRKCFRRIPLHKGVGASGQGMIYDFYKFLLKWSSNKEMVDKTIEYVIPEKVFESILIGDIYPGCIYKLKLHITYICQDLICINCPEYEEAYYTRVYDEDFFVCQNIIRNRLKNEQS